MHIIQGIVILSTPLTLWNIASNALLKDKPNNIHCLTNSKLRVDASIENAS